MINNLSVEIDTGSSLDLPGLLLILLVAAFIIFLLEPYLELLSKRMLMSLRLLRWLRLQVNLFRYKWNLFGPLLPPFRVKLTRLIDAYAEEPVINLETLYQPIKPRYKADWVIQLLDQLPEKRKLRLLEEWHNPSRPTELIKSLKTSEEKLKWIEPVLKNLKAKNRGVEVVQGVFKGMNEGQIVELLNKLSTDSLKELAEKSELIDITYLMLLVDSNSKEKEGNPGNDTKFIEKVLQVVSWEKARELVRTSSALKARFPNLRGGVSLEKLGAIWDQLNLAPSRYPRLGEDELVLLEGEEENTQSSSEK
jgi:hypothetical protein